MLGVQSAHGAARELSRTRTFRGGVPVADEAGDSSDDAAEAPAPTERDAAGPPEGYEREDRVTAAGRKYAVYKAPGGRTLGSQREAWRHYLGVLSHAPAEAGDDAVSPSPAGASAGGFVPAPAAASRRGNSSISPRRGPRPAHAAATASVAFPDDLTGHVVEFDRPPVRRLPSRH